MSNGQGGPQGPVSGATMAQMQGTMQMERGFARMWSAGSSDSVKAAYQKSAERKGAIAAENIRQRFYKKEFEQILETQIKPLTDKLTSARDAYGENTATTVMPIEHQKSQAERVEASGQLNPNTQGELGPIGTPLPGAAPGGDPGAQQAGMVAPPDAQIEAANQILAEPTDIAEKISIRDPVTGGPVELSSARGIAIMGEHAQTFGTAFRTTNMELMEVMSKYSGNPFASRYAESLVDNLAKQAGLNSSGLSDPTKQQEWWEGRQEAEQKAFAAQTANDQAAQQSELNDQQGLLNDQRLAEGEDNAQLREQGEADRQAARRVTATQARNSAASGDLDDYLGADLRGAIAGGDELNDAQNDELIASQNAFESDLQKQINREKSKVGFGFGRQDLRHLENNPGAITEILVNGGWGKGVGSNAYKQEYSAIIADEASNIGKDLKDQYNASRTSGDGSGQRIARKLMDNGASQMAAEAWLESGMVTGEVSDAIEKIASGQTSREEANYRAALSTLPGLAAKQPQLKELINSTIDNYINDQEGDNPFSLEQKELMRISPYATYMEIANDKSDPVDRNILAGRSRYLSPKIRREVIAHKAKWSEINRVEQQADDTRARIASRPVPGSKFKPVVADTEDKSDTIGASPSILTSIKTPSQVETERVYGVGGKGPLSVLSAPFIGQAKNRRERRENEKARLNSRSAVRSNVTNTSESKPISSSLQDSTNEYAKLGMIALTSLIANLPPDSPALPQVTAALELAKGPGSEHSPTPTPNGPLSPTVEREMPTDFGSILSRKVDGIRARTQAKKAANKRKAGRAKEVDRLRARSERSGGRLK